MFGVDAIEKLKEYDFETVLDIGCGGGDHARVFEKMGKRYTGIDYKTDKYIQGDYMETEFYPADCIWACHVLEHQKNVNAFLNKIRGDLKDGGVLCITVPPLKHSIVGGHVTLWNTGLLLYNLILAGFNCRHASAKVYGYNISVIVEKEEIILPQLNSDYGDINILSKYFPLDVRERFNGNIQEINW